MPRSRRAECGGGGWDRRVGEVAGARPASRSPLKAPASDGRCAGIARDGRGAVECVAEGNRYQLPDLSDTALNGANLMDAALIDANLTGV